MKKLSKLDNALLLSQCVLLAVLVIAGSIALFLPGLEDFISYIMIFNLIILAYNFIKIFNKKLFGILCIFCAVVSLLSVFGVINGI